MYFFMSYSFHFLKLVAYVELDRERNIAWVVFKMCCLYVLPC